MADKPPVAPPSPSVRDTRKRAVFMSRLIVENLTKQFPTRSDPLFVLRGISFEMDSGENLSVMGPSGSGKSTLLNILGTLEPPTSGRVVLDGQDPATLAEPALAALRSRSVGLVFQDHHLLPQCSVLENVLVPTIADGTTTQAMVDRARDLIARVGLADRADHRPAELSGGERQRAALARALIHSPALLLADEPTGNLDRTNANRIGELLLELQASQQTMLVVVTHSPALAAKMQRRYELDDGYLKER
jgi:lipoprotein-releasing system ATP-binding protein